MWKTIKENPISTIAVLLVAGIVAYIGYMNYWLTDVLAGPGFCGKAVGADKLTPGPQTVTVLLGCIDMLKLQLEALGTNSHIFAGTFGLCLIVLIVVVIAGARARFKAGKGGLEGEVGRDTLSPAPQVVTTTTTAVAPPAPLAVPPKGDEE